MKVSLSWLNDYVTVDMGIDRLAEALTMAGLEVESVSDRFDYLDQVVVGRIEEINPHPNADKLKNCTVNIGNRQISVVCGAPNVKKNMMVPVALPGTLFPDGNILKKSVIRGSKSHGMICSEKELGLGMDAGGVMSLDPGQTEGKNLAKALNLKDPVVEIDLTPNRPDCLSVLGIAREIAAIQNTTLKYPDTAISDKKNDISKMTSVTIDAPEFCPRYVARMLTDITVKPSPFWLQERLMSVGLRPINNVVDITNFVLMETGQPLHAFDFDELAKKRIIVRTAEQGEYFTTLDNKERKLTSQMLMICDGEKPVGIGGVMGGLNSEIKAGTSKVLLEGAYFNPVSIRKTAKKLGLNTEASHRFERGTDPEGTVTAVNRAARLMAELGEGKLVSGIIDEYPKKIPARKITLKPAKTNRLLGTVFNRQKIKKLLESIEFSVKHDGKEDLLVVPPSFRVDVERPQDLMEEVARLSGYNNIPTTFPAMPAQALKPLISFESRNRIKHKMIGFGFSEAINYSFIHPDENDRLRLNDKDPRRKTVKILNPLSEDQTVMRTSLIPGLLETMHQNISRQCKDLKLFEIGKAYYHTGNDDQPDEREMMAGIWTGARYPVSWESRETACDFYDLKGVLEGLFETFRLNHLEFTKLPNASCTYSKPGHTAGIYSDDTLLGLIGEIHPKVLKNFDLKQTGYIFELDLDKLIPLFPETIHFNPLPKYPSAPRDTTIIIDQKVESTGVLKDLENFNEELIEDLYLFDIFQGGPIPPGKKSISFRVIYRSPERTLEDEEVNLVHKKITKRLLKKFDATLPA